MDALDIKFGKYTLIAKIGDGGMAEVYRAKVTSQSGFEKVVALKKIHTSLSTNDRFVKNFINEARLCGQLHHHNVVEVYEFDKIDDTFYLAMEFIDGMNLEEALRLQRKRDTIFPSNVILSMMLQVLEGLNYAHNAKSMDGKPLKVIHRDLKPSNILIDSNGVVKIVDFGVAKADMQRYATQEMTAKGTASYMAPELILGEQPASAASDLFAVGAILYEMLTLNRLFDGDHVFAILKKVATSNVDEIVSKLSPEDRRFEGVLRKLLARQPDHRVQNAEEITKDLKVFNVPNIGPRHLAKFMRELQEDAEEESPTLLNNGPRVTLQQPQTPPAVDVQNNPLYQTSPTRVAFATEPVQQRPVPLSPAPATSPSSAGSPRSSGGAPRPSAPVAPRPTPAPEEPNAPDDEAVTRVVDMAGGLAPASTPGSPTQLPPPQEPAPSPVLQEVRGHTTSGVSTYGETRAPTRSNNPMLVAAIIMLSILGVGLWVIYPRIQLHRIPLTIETSPAGAQIVLDGEALGPAPFRGEISFKGPAATFKVDVGMTGYEATTRTIDVSADDLSEEQVKLELKPIPINVKVVSIPSGAVIFLDGNAQTLTTPGTVKVNGPGSYHIRVAKDGFEPAGDTRTINSETTVSFELRPVAEPGYDRAVTRPNRMSPREGGRFR